MLGIQSKITRHTKKWENMKNNMENTDSVETDQ